MSYSREKILTAKQIRMGYIQKSDDHSIEAKLQEIAQSEENAETEQATRIIEVGESNDPSIVQTEQIVGLDLMNFRVIGCEDDVAQEVITDTDIDVNDVQQTQYVLHQSPEKGDEKSMQEYQTVPRGTQYMHIVEQDSVPLVFFTDKPNKIKHQVEIGRTGVKRKRDDTAIAKEILDNPNFKAFLYNCKACDFKCNAIKDLTAHRLKEHTTSGVSSHRLRNMLYNMPKPTANPTQSTSNSRESTGADIMFGANMSYCSICSYSSISAQQVKRHILKVHGFCKNSSEQSLDENDVPRESKSHRYNKSYDHESAQPLNIPIYYCDHCGYEGTSNSKFKKHDCNKVNASRNAH